MVTPTERIRAGLDAEAKAKKGIKTPALAAYVGRNNSNLSTLKSTYLRAFQAKSKLDAILAAEVSARDESVAAIKADWADRGKSRDGNIVTDHMGAVTRRKLAKDEITAAHKIRMGKVAEQIATLGLEVIAIRAETEEAQLLWHSPMSRLMVSTLGSERRATRHANLQHAGPYELVGAMRLALDTHDNDLAAACCARYDTIGKDSQKSVTISRDELAHSLMAEEWDTARKSLGMTQFALSTAELAIKDIRGDRITAEDRIKAGLHRAELEADFGAENVNPDAPPKAEQPKPKLPDNVQHPREDDLARFTRLLGEDPVAAHVFGLEKGYIESVEIENEGTGNGSD